MARLQSKKLVNSAKPVDWCFYHHRNMSWDDVAHHFWGYTHYWVHSPLFQDYWSGFNKPWEKCPLTDEITTLAFVFHKGSSNPS